MGLGLTWDWVPHGIRSHMGLGPKFVSRIADIINQIHKKGITVLLVEQNATLALHLANRGYVLETGRITIKGKASDLAQDSRPKEAYLGN